MVFKVSREVCWSKRMSVLDDSLKSEKLPKAVAAGICYFFVKFLHSFFTFQNCLQSTLTEANKISSLPAMNPPTFQRLKMKNTGQLIQSCQFNLAIISYISKFKMPVTPNCREGDVTECLSVLSFQQEVWAEGAEWINSGIVTAEVSFNAAHSTKDSYQSLFWNMGKEQSVKHVMWEGPTAPKAFLSS